MSGGLESDGAVAGPAVVADGRTFQTGDVVVALRNNRRLGLTNGTRGTITAADPGARTVTITTDDHRSILVATSYLDAGRLDHGYAITCHKAQGATTTRAFVLGSDTATREWGYVALSRARDSTRLYVVATPDTPFDDVTHATGPIRPDPLGELVDALRRSDAQVLALDTSGGTLADIATRQRDLGRQLRDHVGHVDPAHLHQLQSHRDSLIASDQPVPDRLDWLIGRLAASQQRLDDLAADPRLADYAALTEALDTTRAHARTAARTCADDYGDLLGPLPDTPTERQRWTAAATTLDTYCTVWHIDASDVLSRTPSSPQQASDLAMVHAALQRVGGHLTRDVDDALTR